MAATPLKPAGRAVPPCHPQQAGGSQLQGLPLTKDAFKFLNQKQLKEEEREAGRPAGQAQATHRQ